MITMLKNEKNLIYKIKEAEELIDESHKLEEALYPLV